MIEELDRQRWVRVRELVESALELPAADRARWLADADADAGIRAAAERLLAADDRRGASLETPLDVTQILESDARPDTPLSAGHRLGAYIVDHELGHGGMGSVYRAWDTRLERWVALKALSPQVAEGSQARERLQREARAAARISHEAVATVHAIEEADGQLFIVSELIAGETLRSRLAGGPLPLPDAVDLVWHVAQGVAAAHELGVVHRDLKPENVLVTPSGRPKVVDFGIASVGGGAGITQTGVVLGTPGYMSPEQVNGQPIDPRSDVFTLGVLLYEAITGKAPVGRTASWSVVSAVLEREPAPPGQVVAGIPASLDRVVATCMAKSPAMRYPTAAAVAAALAEVRGELAGPDQPSAPPPTLETVGDDGRWWLRFHQLAASIAMALMMVPAWRLMRHLPRVPGRLLVMTLLVVAAGVGTARLHLWFTARHHDADLDAEAARVGWFVRWGNRAFAVLLGAGGAAVIDHSPELAGVCMACATGTLVAGEIIEPATLTRALDERRRAARRP